ILPGTSPMEEAHCDVAFPQLSHRNHVRYSKAVMPPTQPAEWEILLRLTAILMDRGAGADIAALDDELVAEDVGRMAGSQAPAVLKAVQHLRGPDRLLDLALRGGPYGDMFGMKPGGLN